MINEVLNTKVDAFMTVLSVSLLLPVEWADLAIKAVPALCATVYWVVRIVDQKNNRNKTKVQ